jgi:hypothetical protein
MSCASIPVVVIHPASEDDYKENTAKNDADEITESDRVYFAQTALSRKKRQKLSKYKGPHSATAQPLHTHSACDQVQLPDHRLKLSWWFVSLMNATSNGKAFFFVSIVPLLLAVVAGQEEEQ